MVEEDFTVMYPYSFVNLGILVSIFFFVVSDGKSKREKYAIETFLSFFFMCWIGLRLGEGDESLNAFLLGLSFILWIRFLFLFNKAEKQERD